MCIIVRRRGVHPISLLRLSLLDSLSRTSRGIPYGVDRALNWSSACRLVFVELDSSRHVGDIMLRAMRRACRWCTLVGSHS